MKYDFDEQISRRGTDSYKWDSAENENVLPMWVADMDFRTAPVIVDALHRRVEHGIFGYTMIYSFCVLAGLLTATVITHIVLASIFTYILPLVIALKEAWFGLFFVTYMYKADDWIANCSPISYFFVKSTENRGSRYILVFIIVSLIVSAINFGVCILRLRQACQGDSCG